MSYKSENWQDKLQEVRAFNKKEEELKEEVSPKIDEEIELLLQEIDGKVEACPTCNHELHEGRSMKLDQIAKKYKRDIEKCIKTGQLPEWQSPLHIAMERHAFDHGLIRNDDSDHIDDVLETLFDDIIDDPKNGFKEEVVKEFKEEKLTVEKTVEKLTEKNMLGRLAKQLRLNEEGKKQMFDYFEKGSLNQ